MKAIVDNDILLKGTCYGLLAELMGAVPGEGTVGILGAARFVVLKQLRKKDLRGSAAAAQARFLAFLVENEVLEPSAEEQRLAAILEASAQSLAVNLDTGESQMVSILVLRTLPWLLTGDKRAIAALEQLLDAGTDLATIAGKVKCLEQLFRLVVTNLDIGFVRGAVCGEPSVDKTLSICFSCTSSGTDSRTVCEGLESYIRNIRASAGRVLAI
jgi:hypothetical protein